MTDRRPIVYVFARAPALGAVKRRLAAGIGPVRAVAFYRQTSLQVVRDLASDPRWRTILALTPDRATARPGGWPASIARVAQGGGDLGRRMARVLARDPRRPALIVGSDIPDLKPRHVARAFAALKGADMVFGPAEDGGYWLVGRRPGLSVPDLFEGVRWSSPHALADTRAGIPARHRVALVDRLEDVDDAEAFARWRLRRSYPRGAR